MITRRKKKKKKAFKGKDKITKSQGNPTLPPMHYAFQEVFIVFLVVISILSFQQK